jgi:hypothetical protein
MPALLAPGPAAAAGADRRAHCWPCCRCTGASTACPRRTACSTTACARRGAVRAARGGAGLSRASATSTSSSRCATCPACACVGAQPGRAGGLPTGSCCPAPRSPAPTWPGCARRGWTPPLPRTRARRRRVLGVCGGLQMLGEALIDLTRMAIARQRAMPRLGLLPLVTRFEQAIKTVRVRTASGRWTGPVGRAVRRGRWRLRDPPRRDRLQHPAMARCGRAVCATRWPGWQNGRQRAGPVPARPVRVAAVLQALFGKRGCRCTLDEVFDGSGRLHRTAFRARRAGGMLADFSRPMILFCFPD